jgi:hypothetical protein
MGSKSTSIERCWFPANRVSLGLLMPVLVKSYVTVILSVSSV